METPRKIGYEIRAVSNLIKRKSYVMSAGDQTQLTEMRGKIIGFLYDHQGEDIFQRDLEAAFSIRRSTVSRFLSALEHQGLLERRPVPQDARLKKLALTPKAVAEHEEIMARIHKIESAIAQGLSEKELQEFSRILLKIKQNLS